MCPGGIAWCAFSWEAFATLVVGIVAVIAAAVVGWRQTDILSRQATLQHTSVKNDLFDRRYSVFQRVEKFLIFILQHAREPDRNIENDFLMAKAEARFLFSHVVQDGLAQIWKDVGDYVVLKTEMESIYRREQHYGEGNSHREQELFRLINTRFKNLPDLFDEMKLG